MKQTTFIVEVCVDEDKPVIIIRHQNGAILKITSEPSDVATFLEQGLEAWKIAPTDSNSNK